MDQDILDLDRAVEDFCQYVEQLPPEQLVERLWGPLEVLAHLMYWHELYVRQARSCLAGETIGLLSGRYHDLNAQAVAHSRGLPAAALVARFRAANRQLAEIYRSCDPLLVTVPIKTGVRGFTLSSLVPAVTRHVRSHLRLLKQEARRWTRQAER